MFASKVDSYKRSTTMTIKYLSLPLPQRWLKKMARLVGRFPVWTLVCTTSSCPNIKVIWRWSNIFWQLLVNEDFTSTKPQNRFIFFAVSSKKKIAIWKSAFVINILKQWIKIISVHSVFSQVTLWGIILNQYEKTAVTWELGANIKSYKRLKSGVITSRTASDCPPFAGNQW